MAHIDVKGSVCGSGGISNVGLGHIAPVAAVLRTAGKALITYVFRPYNKLQYYYRLCCNSEVGAAVVIDGRGQLG